MDVGPAAWRVCFAASVSVLENGGRRTTGPFRRGRTGVGGDHELHGADLGVGGLVDGDGQAALPGDADEERADGGGAGEAGGAQDTVDVVVELAGQAHAAGEEVGHCAEFAAGANCVPDPRPLKA